MIMFHSVTALVGALFCVLSQAWAQGPDTAGGIPANFNVMTMGFNYCELAEI